MRSIRGATAIAAALFLVVAGIAEARPGGGGNRGGNGAQRHHGHGGHGHKYGHGRHYYRPYYYPYFSSFYYPPAYYPPAVYVAPAAAPVYIEQGQPVPAEPSPQPEPQARPAPQAQPAVPNYWYFCAATQAYYPDVGSCAGGWQRVPAQPQD
jgi:hypothetical protein